MTAASVVVGNSIGAKNISAAKIYMNMSFTSASLWACISVTLLILFKDALIRLFTSSAEVNVLINTAFTYIWMNIVMDYLLRGS